MNWLLYGERSLLIVIALGLWFWTQWLLGRRLAPVATPTSPICDGVHRLTAPIHKRLWENPRKANLLLISSSLVIDLLGFYLLASSIFGHTIEPFAGLFLLFALRQICQAFCPLPPPEGMIWRNPGVPSILVTYGTTNDLFFSGHTAIAVYGGLYLAMALGPLGVVLGVFIILFEVSTVLLLRAHYTMDVFTGAICALYVTHVAAVIAPHVDAFLARL